MDRLLTPFLRRALDTAPDAIAILDQRHRIVYLNPPAAALLRTSRGARPRLSGLCDRRTARSVLAALHRRDRWQEQVEFADPSDQRRWLSLRVAPIHDRRKRFVGTILLANDVTDRARAERQSEYLAHHDSLTSLANRRRLKSELSSRLERKEPQCAVLTLDLDRFKAINDLLGHPLGDRLLIRIADLLREFCGPEDLVARLGGDEFALLITGADIAKRAEDLAGAIVDRLGRSITIGSRQLNTGVSVGVLIVEAAGCTVEEAMRRADVALYHSKRRGRGRYTIYEPEMTLELGRRSVVEAELRQAIAAEDIYLEYQPLVSVPLRRLEGFEALARWRSARFGAVPPGEFIGLTEETGLLLDLTRNTLAEGCAMAADWRRRGFSGRVALNVSPLLFRDDVASLVKEALARTGCPPHAIEVEVTENLLLKNTESNRLQIMELREMGIEIALDDFGVGHSSVGYLKEFAFDRIKIDRSFVAEIGRNPRAPAIVTALSNLGHALGVDVSAEGVERPDQAAAVAVARCERMQGFLFGRPEPGRAATERVLDFLLEESGATIAKKADLA